MSKFIGWVLFFALLPGIWLPFLVFSISRPPDFQKRLKAEERLAAIGSVITWAAVLIGLRIYKMYA